MTKFNPDPIIYARNGKTPMRMPAPEGKVGATTTVRRALFFLVDWPMEGDDKMTEAEKLRLNRIGTKLWTPELENDDDEDARDDDDDVPAAPPAKVKGKAAGDEAGGETASEAGLIEFSSKETDMILERSLRFWGPLVYAQLVQHVDPARLEK